MQIVEVIGMGMGLGDLTPRHLELIHRAEVLVGGKRLLALFPDAAAEKIPVTRRISEVLELIRHHMAERRVVVLASGDPLFYGIGATLVRELGEERVRIHPNITTVAAAFARLKLPWSRARIISCHGREAREEIRRELREAGPGPILALLTDPQHSPDWIARFLLAADAGSVEMCVLEHLGMADEQIRWLTPDRAAELTFADPNLVVLRSVAHTEKEPSGKAPLPGDLHLGLADGAFNHERGLITKAEVRAVSLAKLRLQPGMTLWDLGAGSGAVGIEASVLLGSGRIIAVEKNPRRVAHIEANAARYGVANLEAHCLELPGGLGRLPDPDRVFIGGGGKDLAAIVAQAARRLPVGGLLVINLVVLQNLAAVLACCETLGLKREVIQLQVQRSRLIPGAGERLEALNPVWIIAAEKVSD